MQVPAGVFHAFAPGREVLAALDHVRPARADSRALQTAAAVKLVCHRER